MPLYEFACADCGKEFELLVGSTRWQGTPCPHCGSKKLAKKLSVFASQAATGESSAPAPQACARPGGCGCVGRHNH